MANSSSRNPSISTSADRTQERELRLGILAIIGIAIFYGVIFYLAFVLSGVTCNLVSK